MSTSDLAPIALFAYNRPWHVAQTLSSISRCRNAAKTRVFAFVDGARSEADTAKVSAVRAAIAPFRPAFADLEIITRDSNLGLAGNVISGVTQVINTFGRGIILEDDMITAPGFLDYMNRFLRQYAEEQLVGSIHGYSFPQIRLDAPYYFLKGGDCWGWATWKDRWDLFEPNGRLLFEKLLSQDRMEGFTLSHSSPHCRLLCRQILGLNDSWAIRWHASLYLAGRLTLHPSQSLIRNIGLDGSGENCDDRRDYDTGLGDYDDKAEPPYPIEVDEAAVAHCRSTYLQTQGAIGTALRNMLSRALDEFYIMRVKAVA